MKPKRPPMRTPGYTRSQHWQDVLLITVLSIALILCALYIVDWYRDRARVQGESASYRQSYVRDERPARPAPSTASAASGTSEGMEIVTDIPTATRGADTPATLQSMEIVTDIPTDAVPVATGIPNISGAEPIIVDTPLENAAPDDDAAEYIDSLEKEIQELRNHHKAVMRELRTLSETEARLIQEREIDRQALSTVAGKIGTITWRECNVG